MENIQSLKLSDNLTYSDMIFVPDFIMIAPLICSIWLQTYLRRHLSGNIRSWGNIHEPQIDISNT